MVIGNLIKPNLQCAHFVQQETDHKFTK